MIDNHQYFEFTPTANEVRAIGPQVIAVPSKYFGVQLPTLGDVVGYYVQVNYDCDCDDGTAPTPPSPAISGPEDSVLKFNDVAVVEGKGDDVGVKHLIIPARSTGITVEASSVKSFTPIAIPPATPTSFFYEAEVEYKVRLLAFVISNPESKSDYSRVKCCDSTIRAAFERIDILKQHNDSLLAKIEGLEANLLSIEQTGSTGGTPPVDPTPSVVGKVLTYNSLSEIPDSYFGIFGNSLYFKHPNSSAPDLLRTV